MELPIEKLSDELFWDVDKSRVTEKRHARWILERVLERGRWEDWLTVRDHFGRTLLEKLAPRLRVDPKSRHFLKLYLES